MYKKIKRLFYVSAFFEQFVLIFPLYGVMFGNYGLNATSISILFVVSSVITFFMEVPSGAIADRYPRRTVLGLAQLIRGVGFAFWLLMPNFLGFLIGIGLWGIKTALTSGTKEALVYDELKREDKLKKYTQVMGKMNAIGLVARILGAFAAVYVVQFGYQSILIASIVACLISSLCIFLLPKTVKIKSTDESSYWIYLKKGIKAAFSSPRLILIISFSSIVGGLGAANEYFKLLFQEQGINVQLIAFWVAMIYLVGALSSLVAGKFENRKMPEAWALIAWAILLASSTVLPPALSPVAIALFYGFYSFTKVLYNTYLQNELDSNTRATTTSVNGFMSEIVALIVFGGFALLGDSNTYALGLQIMSGFIVVFAVLYAAFRQKLTNAS
jgi:MFS family permease